MWQKSLIALALAGSVTLVGCGGGSSGGGSGSNNNNDGSNPPAPTARNDVSGSLDAVQGPVSIKVLRPLATATAGTPVSGVVACVDQIVIGDTFDILDLLAARADVSSSSFQGSAALVQTELTNLVADLQGLLFSLAGGAGCGDVIPVQGDFTTNPLAGTPLEDFAATLLSTLGLVQGQLSGSGVLDLSVLTALVGQLADGYASALEFLPVDAISAPVVGPSLTLVGTALYDLEDTVGAADSGDLTAVVAQITATVGHLLNGLLTDVLPINQLELLGGVGGGNPLSGPITAALDQLNSLLSSGLSNTVPDLGADALTGVIQSLLTPLIGVIPGVDGGEPTVVLTTLLAQITGVLGGGTGGLPIPLVGPAALNDALAQITSLLSGASTLDSPLAPLIDTLLGLLSGVLGDLGN